MTSYKKEVISEVAQAVMAAGYRAFLAESEEYGFYTDADGTRVISFQTDFFRPVFSGNYVTNQPRNTGTGWQMAKAPALTKPVFDDMFNASAPRWAVKDATWRYATLADHLKRYGNSSRYVEQSGGKAP